MLSLPYDLWSEWTKSQSSDEDSRSQGKAGRQALGHTAPPLIAAGRKPPGPPPVPCHPQSHVTSTWTASEGLGRVTALSEHACLSSWRGGVCWWFEAHHLRRQNVWASRGAATIGTPSQDPSVCCAHCPGGGGCWWWSSAQMTGTRITRSGAAGRRKLLGPLAQAHCVQRQLKYWCVSKSCFRPSFQGNTLRVFQKKS